jgi:hypothetical protein
VIHDTSAELPAHMPVRPIDLPIARCAQEILVLDVKRPTRVALAKTKQIQGIGIFEHLLSEPSANYLYQACEQSESPVRGEVLRAV